MAAITSATISDLFALERVFFSLSMLTRQGLERIRGFRSKGRSCVAKCLQILAGDDCEKKRSVLVCSCRRGLALVDLLACRMPEGVVIAHRRVRLECLGGSECLGVLAPRISRAPPPRRLVPQVRRCLPAPSSPQR